MAIINKTGISNGGTIQAEHVTRAIDALSGGSTDTIVATGSFSGSLNGIATSASFAESASYALNSPTITLTSAGGTSLINDGTGPSLAIKGLSAGSGITVNSNLAQTILTIGIGSITASLINGPYGSNSVISASYSETASLARNLTLTPIDPLPSGVATGSFAVSASTPPKPYFWDGSNWNALY